MDLSGARKTLGRALTDELLARMARGDYVVGQLLPTERGLMQEFGVGRNTVRESIQSLVAMGLVEVRPGLGTKVLPQSADAAARAIAYPGLFDDQSVSDLYEFRQMVEVGIARKAAASPNREKLAEAEYWHERYREALHRGQPAYQEDVELHRSLALVSGNSVALLVLDELREVLEAVRRATAAVPTAEERALIEHEAIIKAIKAGDIELAAEAMQVHLESAHWALAEARRLSQAQSRLAVDGSADGAGA